MKNFYLNLKLLLAIAFSAFIQQTHAQYYEYVYDGMEFYTTNSDGVKLHYRICRSYNQYGDYIYAELIECDKNYSGNVNIPNSVEFRVFLGFDETAGEEVYLSYGFSVESIGSKAFNNCKYISSIYVPNSVDHINLSTFVGCSNISLNIEEGNNEIEFSGANSNSQIEHIFLGRDIKNYNYELDYDDTETKVFYSPFANLTSLKSITFSKKINKIPTLAFKNCSSLNSIIIHENINEIGSCAFEGCKNLNMTISDNNKYYYTEDKILFNKNKTKILGAWKEGTYSIPNSVTSIGSSAFEGCSGLSSITIPNSVTYIYAATFSNCSKLTNLTIEDGVKTLYFANPYSIVDNCYFVSYGSVFENSPIENLYIGRDINYESYDFIGDLLSGAPFSYSKNLKSVTIGEKVTKIHDYFFIGCDKISSLIIPNNVTSIGKYAFYGNKLQSITVAKDNANYSSNEGILFNKNRTTLIQYPCGKQGAYTIPDNVTTIEEYAFYGSSGLSSITIPNSVTNIKEYAFYGCSGLSSITIPNSVTNIKEYAFYGCSGLSSITIPNSVTNIKEYAFYNCSGLTHLTIGNSVEEIAYRAFGECNKIKEIYILNPTPPTCDNAFNYSVNKSIPIYVLSNNYGTKWGNFTNIIKLLPITFTALNQDNKELTYSIPTYEKFENKEADFIAGTSTYRGSIVIPTNVMYNNKYYKVKTIANGAFKNCSTLTSVILPKQTEEIEEEAFSGCNRLKEIYFPNSTKRIGIAAFEECTGLEEIIIGTNLESIGEFAFVGCTGLKEIYSLSIIPANCDTDAFLDVDTSIPIYIPVGTKAAYQSAPEWKNFTNFIESDFTDIKDNKVSTYNIKTIVGNGIAINDYYGKLRIVSLSGQVVKEMTVNGYAQIDLPKGAYIIVTNNNSQKVIL